MTKSNGYHEQQQAKCSFTIFWKKKHTKPKQLPATKQQTTHLGFPSDPGLPVAASNTAVPLKRRCFPGRILSKPWGWAIQIHLSYQLYQIYLLYQLYLYMICLSCLLYLLYYIFKHVGTISMLLWFFFV